MNPMPGWPMNLMPGRPYESDANEPHARLTDESDATQYAVNMPLDILLDMLLDMLLTLFPRSKEQAWDQFT